MSTWNISDISSPSDWQDSDISPDYVRLPPREDRVLDLSNATAVHLNNDNEISDFIKNIMMKDLPKAMAKVERTAPIYNEIVEKPIYFIKTPKRPDGFHLCVRIVAILESVDAYSITFFTFSKDGEYEGMVKDGYIYYSSSDFANKPDEIAAELYRILLATQ
jgi:hypothetical protein